MVKQFFVFALAVSLALPLSVRASQNTTSLPLTGTYSGLTAAGIINGANDTMISNFSGTSAPSSPTNYQYWADTTNSLLKFYDGSNWLPMGKFSSSFWNPMANGVLSLLPASTGSSNAYVVTQTPAISSYRTGQLYGFIANFANTGTATVDFGPGAITIKKNYNTNLAANDIKSGQAVVGYYDGASFQMTSQLGNASTGGTVTSVATGTGLTGGTITSTGTLSLATIANNTVLGNVSGSTAAPSAITPSQILSGISTTQGTVLYYNGSNWVALSPGSSGQILQTNGAGANPSWVAKPTPGFSSCTTVTASAASTSVSATCGSGYTMTGGGCYPNTNPSDVRATYPSGSQTWICVFTTSSGNTAYVRCCQ